MTICFVIKRTIIKQKSATKDFSMTKSSPVLLSLYDKVVFVIIITIRT